jgi:predicted polyphosphate/ATP-dependent NAD kinase
MAKFKLGFLINPLAGLGGSVALKGSDGVAAQALALGAEPKAQQRAAQALEVLLPYKDQLVIFTVNGSMGADCAAAMGFDIQQVYCSESEPTTAADTQAALKELQQQGIDLLLFAGGDGTARDICAQIDGLFPVLGIPAGVKIHSGVYSVTPKAAGRVVEMLLNKELVSFTEADVMDIDEVAFRQGRVKAKRYGEMQVPSEHRYLQATKSGGRESDDLVLQDIAAHLIEQMDEQLFIMGSGSTVAFIMEELGIDNTLLGVDLVQDQQLLAADVTEQQLFEKITQAQADKVDVNLVITLIGGQGHIFGRGNQQLSPRVIRAIGKQHIIIVATKSKLTALNNRPLIIDTGDSELDAQLTGYLPVHTGYKDQVLYPAASPGLDE